MEPLFSGRMVALKQVGETPGRRAVDVSDPLKAH